MRPLFINRMYDRQWLFQIFFASLDSCIILHRKVVDKSREIPNIIRCIYSNWTEMSLPLRITNKTRPSGLFRSCTFNKEFVYVFYCIVVSPNLTLVSHLCDVGDVISTIRNNIKNTNQKRLYHFNLTKNCLNFNLLNLFKLECLIYMFEFSEWIAVKNIIIVLKIWIERICIVSYADFHVSSVVHLFQNLRLHIFHIIGRSFSF